MTYVIYYQLQNLLSLTYFYTFHPYLICRKLHSFVTEKKALGQCP